MSLLCSSAERKASTPPRVADFCAADLSGLLSFKANVGGPAQTISAMGI
jgi:hypothetical protein